MRVYFMSMTTVTFQIYGILSTLSVVQKCTNTSKNAEIITL